MLDAMLRIEVVVDVVVETEGVPLFGAVAFDLIQILTLIEG